MMDCDLNNFRLLSNMVFVLVSLETEFYLLSLGLGLSVLENISLGLGFWLLPYAIDSRVRMTFLNLRFSFERSWRKS